MFWRFIVDTNSKLYIFNKKMCFTTPLIGNVIFSKAYYSNVEKLEVKCVKTTKTDLGTEKILVSHITDLKKNFPDSQLNITKHMNQQRKSFKQLKYIFGFLSLSVTIVGTYLFFNFEYVDKEGQDVPLWKRYLLNITRQINTFAVFIQEPSREKLLPDPVTYPYYQPPYTLLLEFTDVLAHPDWTYKTGWRFKKRPGLDYFLESLVGLYEIVVFTAEPGMTIFPVIDALDQKHLISYKLVRDSTHFVDGHHVKNLDKLNRDLKKVIVVDWNAESLKFHPDNHFNLGRWKGEDTDAALVDLTAFLKTIALTEIDDVREVLKYYKQFEDPLLEFRKKQKEYFEQNEQTPLSRPSQSIKNVIEFIK